MASKPNEYPYCLDPGRLRQRVTIETASDASDGEPNPTYTALASGVAAEVIETTGGEWIRGRQIEAGVRAVITIRHRADITPRMRIRHGSSYWNIRSVIDPTGYGTMLTIQCEEIRP